MSEERDLIAECEGNEDFWLMMDSDGVTRVIYDLPPAFMKIPVIHLVRASALTAAIAERDSLREMVRVAEFNRAAFNKLEDELAALNDMPEGIRPADWLEFVERTINRARKLLGK